MNMLTLSYPQIVSAFNRKGYKFFTGAYDMNVFGIRSANRDQSKDLFDDYLGIAYKDKDGIGRLYIYHATTDPGNKELLSPSFAKAQRNGTAVVAPGQYPKAYKIGRHGDWIPGWGHDALVQDGKLRIYRDGDHDSVIEYTNPADSTPEDGINIHASSIWGELEHIGPYSAGCQVFKNGGQQKDFMKHCQLQKANGLGDRFTYTLFEEQDILIAA